MIDPRSIDINSPENLKIINDIRDKKLASVQTPAIQGTAAPQLNSQEDIDNFLETPRAKKIIQDIIDKKNKRGLRKIIKDEINSDGKELFDILVKHGGQDIKLPDNIPLVGGQTIRAGALPEAEKYSDALGQAILENFLGATRLALRPFSQDAANSIAKINKDSQDNFDFKYSDDEGVKAAKEIYKFATLAVMPTPGAKIKAVSSLGKMGKLGMFLLKNSGLGSIYGAATAAPGQTLSNAAETGALAGTVGGAAIEGLAKSGPVLSRAFMKLFGTISPEEILNNVGRMAGKPFLGSDILQSAPLQRFQMWMKHFVTSGTAGKAKKIINDLIKNSENVYDDLTGKYAGETPVADLGNLIYKKIKSILKTSEKLYDAVGPFKFNADNIGSVSKEALKELGKFEKKYPGFADDIKPVKKYLKTLSKMKGIQADPEDAKFAKSAAKHLDETSSMIPSYAKPYLYKTSKAIRDAVKDGVEKYGTPLQKKLFDIAEKHYKEKNTLIMKDEMKPFVRNIDKLNSYKLSRRFGERQIHNDPTAVKLITDIGGNDAKNLINAKYFDGAKKDPVKLISKYKDMSEEAKQNLLTKSQRDALDKLKEQLDFSTSAIEKVFNAPTGVNTAPQQAQMASAFAFMGALSGAFKVLSGNMSGLSELFMSLAALSGGPLFSALLDSPVVLTALAKAAMKPTSEAISKTSTAPFAAAANNLFGDENEDTF